MCLNILCIYGSLFVVDCGIVRTLEEFIFCISDYLYFYHPSLQSWVTGPSQRFLLQKKLFTVMNMRCLVSSKLYLSVQALGTRNVIVFTGVQTDEFKR